MLVIKDAILHIINCYLVQSLCLYFHYRAHFRCLSQFIIKSQSRSVLLGNLSRGLDKIFIPLKDLFFCIILLYFNFNLLCAIISPFELGNVWTAFKSLGNLKKLLKLIIIYDVWIIVLDLAFVPLLANPALATISPRMIMSDIIMPDKPSKDDLV